MDKQQRKLTSLESLLPGVAKKLGIEARMKEIMVMNYWSEIARGEIGKDSRAYSITKTKKGFVLNIAAKSTIVAQELSMVKIHLKDKINSLAHQVGFNISDIVISTKFWGELQEYDLQNTMKEKDDNEIIENKELVLEEISLDEKQKSSIEKALADLTLQEDVKIRMKEVLERDLKLKLFKERMGYPVCKSCGVFLRHSSQNYCPVCRFQ
ncbi:MAG: DUF721 domain-containing protein [Cyanobacteriota bacterium]